MWPHHSKYSSPPTGATVNIALRLKASQSVRTRAAVSVAPASVALCASRRHSEYSSAPTRRKQLLSLAVDISPAVPLRLAELQMQRLEEDGFSPDGYSYLGQLGLGPGPGPGHSPSPDPGPGPGSNPDSNPIPNLNPISNPNPNPDPNQGCFSLRC